MVFTEKGKWYPYPPFSQPCTRAEVDLCRKKRRGRKDGIEIAGGWRLFRDIFPFAERRAQRGCVWPARMGAAEKWQMQKRGLLPPRKSAAPGSKDDAYPMVENMAKGKA